MKYNFYPFCKGKDYELVLINGNKAVIKMNTGYMRAPYNGYVVFPAKDIPEDWHGNYNAGALQYLDIHGGITFCECYINDKQKNLKYIKKTKKKLEKIKEKDFGIKFRKQRKIRLKANREIAKSENSYVVFGFDCAHSGDDRNLMLRHSKHIMLLTEKMEQQLIDYAKIYKDWKKMSRKEQIKAIELITGKMNINEIGFGAMIDMLGGATSFIKEAK